MMYLYVCLMFYVFCREDIFVTCVCLLVCPCAYVCVYVCFVCVCVRVFCVCVCVWTYGLMIASFCIACKSCFQYEQKIYIRNIRVIILG
jgi:hypothetical protein